MEFAQLQIPLDHPDRALPPVAALGEIALLPKFSEPPVLIRRRATCFIFHFNEQAMVLPAGNWKVEIRDAPAHSHAFELGPLRRRAVSLIGHVVEHFKTGPFLSDRRLLGPLDNGNLMLCLSQNAAPSLQYST